MNSPIEKTKQITAEETTPGKESGTTIFISAPTFDAPSMRAESSRSFGIVLKYSIEYGNITASAVLAIIFPVLFVLIFQRYIIKGLTAGAVKE